MWAESDPRHAPDFESSHKDYTTPRAPTGILKALEDGEVVWPFLEPIPLPLAQTGADSERQRRAGGSAQNGYNGVEGYEVRVVGQRLAVGVDQEDNDGNDGA